jgi:hypothetical protein
MPPDGGDAAYLWDIVDAARAIVAMPIVVEHR